MSGERERPSARGDAGTAEHTKLALELPADVLDAVAERAAEIVLERLGEPTPSSPWLDVAGAAEYIAAPVSRIYALVSANRIPHHRDGSRLLFHRDELDDHIRSGGGKRP
ncbi:MAG TPA: excisionase family DNA-binding protein [Solirubrobacterales bacterium]|nr:excisionase family DNA-binding protein [Solirubrobacterales bacterium]